MTLLFYTVIDIFSVLFLYIQEKCSLKREEFSLNPFFVSKNDFFSILSVLLLTAVIIFRDSVGNDYEAYALVYLDIVRENLSDMEIAWLSPVFIFICSLLGYIAPNNYYFMF